MRLVQLVHPDHGRRVAIVDGERLDLLLTFASCYDLANAAIERGGLIEELAHGDRCDHTFDYDPIYECASPWRLLPSFDHPLDAAHCLVSGTGLTHKASAENRARMHGAQQPATVTDSMRMYQWGLEGGTPAAGQIGVQPEWFFKGNGSILRAHGEPLPVPDFAEDGGEEPEIAGVYLIARDGLPWRVGLTAGDEFSDHQMERRNYLYLAPSKLRACAIGPELVVGEMAFDHVHGRVAVERGGATLWSAEVFTGERNMSHSLTNLEHHHFKYPEHRRPGDVHIHFFGADAFSFGAGMALQDGDVMRVAWEGFGRELKNPISIEAKPAKLQTVRAL